MNLQYMLCSGNWVNCNDRTEMFLERCVKFGGYGSREATIAALESGKIMRIDSGVWYSICRIKPSPPVSEISIKFISCKRCGNIVGFDGSYPFATISGGGICDDCL